MRVHNAGDIRFFLHGVESCNWVLGTWVKIEFSQCALPIKQQMFTFVRAASLVTIRVAAGANLVAN